MFCLLSGLCSNQVSKWCQSRKERWWPPVQWNYWCVYKNTKKWWFCWTIPWFCYFMCWYHCVSWMLLWVLWYIEANYSWWRCWCCLVICPWLWYVSSDCIHLHYNIFLSTSFHSLFAKYILLTMIFMFSSW